MLGRRSGFRFVGSPSGDVHWMASVRMRGRAAAVLRDLSAAGARRWTVERHRDDPPPIPALLAATPGEIGRWPEYAPAGPPRWHRGAVCLAGDAARATAVPLDQGASLAMEDGIVLGKCLRDLLRLEDALGVYERCRRARVDLVARHARRTDPEALDGRAAGWLRSVLGPLRLLRAARAARPIHAHRIDWNTRRL
jgi:2-polyprenyl-6-methoxyphenol hydroxylase-like FAD-dependent oxidoreductase